jgi:hypothetical protein
VGCKAPHQIQPQTSSIPKRPVSRPLLLLRTGSGGRPSPHAWKSGCSGEGSTIGKHPAEQRKAIADRFIEFDDKLRDIEEHCRVLELVEQLSLAPPAALREPFKGGNGVALASCARPVKALPFSARVK